MVAHGEPCRNDVVHGIAVEATAASNESPCGRNRTLRGRQQRVRRPNVFEGAQLSARL